jgi:hypothetical protein
MQRRMPVMKLRLHPLEGQILYIVLYLAFAGLDNINGYTR